MALNSLNSLTPTTRRTGISILLCIACVIGGGMIFQALAALKKPPSQREVLEKNYNVEVFDVEQTDLQEIISAFGTARSDREVVLSAQVAGEAVEVHPNLKIGQQVRPIGESQRIPGDLLVQIDRSTYEERVTQAEKRLAEDDAELGQVAQELINSERVREKTRQDFALYKDEYARIQDLHKRKVAADSELTRARLQLQQYETAMIRSENEYALLPLRRAQIESRKQTHLADLQLAELDLQRTAVRPPFPGVLSEIMVEQGQYLRTGDSLARLTSVVKVEIPVPLSLTDYAKIEPKVRGGERPHVVLAENETAPGRWVGQVVRVAPVADESTRTVNVFIEVNNEEQEIPLLPGTFVHARINGPLLSQAIVVPRDALLNGRLYVAGNGRAEERTVEVERTLQSLVVVSAGLEHNEQLVLTNLDVIHDGAQISIQQHRKLADELSRQRIEVVRQIIAADGGPLQEDRVN